MSVSGVFPFAVSWSTTVKTEYSVLSADFGDGYAQRSPNGMNPRKQTWEMGFDKRNNDEIQQIVDWFDLRMGSWPFQFQPENRRELLTVVCTGHNVTIEDNGHKTLRATVEETRLP